MSISKSAVPLLALVLGACAGQPTEAPTEAAEVDRFCLTETGTRVMRGEGECVAGGRVVTREELERSGGMTTGEALRRTLPR